MRQQHQRRSRCWQGSAQFGWFFGCGVVGRHGSRLRRRSGRQGGRRGRNLLRLTAGRARRRRRGGRHRRKTRSQLLVRVSRICPVGNQALGKLLPLRSGQSSCRRWRHGCEIGIIGPLSGGQIFGVRRRVGIGVVPADPGQVAPRIDRIAGGKPEHHREHCKPARPPSWAFGRASPGQSPPGRSRPRRSRAGHRPPQRSRPRRSRRAGRARPAIPGGAARPP